MMGDEVEGSRFFMSVGERGKGGRGGRVEEGFAEEGGGQQPRYEVSVQAGLINRTRGWLQCLGSAGRREI
jgi:hypothetical protein